MKRLLACCGVLAMLSAYPVFADTVVFNSGSTAGGNSVDGQASFDISSGQVVITLNDLLVNPTSAGQLLSGLLFNMSTNDTAATLSSSSADLIKIGSGGSVTDLGTSTLGWDFGSGTLGAGNYLLCTVCGSNGVGSGAAPKQTIIGPGPYTSANPSITGNSHNPHVNQSATFTILDSAITDSTTISNVTFSFGTSFGPAADSPGTLAPTPEPGTLGFLAIASILLALVAARKARLKTEQLT